MPNKRALIVDDSTTAQYRLKKMLRPYDLDTDSVDSGEAALRYLATHIPDVIFMDHLMPGMDGFRALQIIKSHPETAMIPVIMYTSKSGDVYTGQARALGALDVVSKDSINAADLSNVMRTIHIYRTDENQSTENPTTEHKSDSSNPREKTDAYDSDKGSSKYVDITNHAIERKASTSVANTEQARNLELRLSHMEHTLEDSRRFITERVVRELQSLKQNIKQEFNEIAEHNHAAHPLPSEQKYTVGGIIWSIVSKLFILAPLVAIAFYMMEMNDALTQSKQQQQLLSKQLNALSGQSASAEPTTVVTNLGNVPAATDTSATPTTPPIFQRMDKNYLADIAWTFNQTAALPFNQNDIDTNVVIRLYELLNRLAINGFKGTAWVNIYVGNFCLATDNVGQAQLVSDSNFMGTCMLSGEVYGMDRLMEQYAHDVESALAGLDQRGEKGIHVIINTLSEPDDYPERKATLSAKTWNAAAQKHNRIEIKLDDKVSESSQANASSARAK